MFSRVATILYALLALATLAAATRTPTTVTVDTCTTKTVTATAPACTVTQPASQCNTGPIQCCNSVESAKSDPVTKLLGLLNVVLSDLNIQVGLTCSPISILGGGGAGCVAQPVCCQNNEFNGVIAIGCVPVNINL
ncbi:hydrophobin [Moniliophthora roreri MCA 2997]|uniref:Hydrophobin n=2 Tax=Moniliophthora roreri TaxID=221103 RepID=V2WJ38_MONRO|nr:hydrophobin [Moniliophthora roreri MCA 2997]KAI3595906.1 hydrophobin [Moniliophthora roreri]